MISNLLRDRHILWALTWRDISYRYNGTFLGLAWSLISPLASGLSIGFVYSIVFGIPLNIFIPGLFAGLLPWLFITACAELGAGSYIAAEGFITQTNISTLLFPLKSCLTSFFHLLVGLSAFVIMTALIPSISLPLSFFYLACSLIILLLAGIGIAMITAMINLKFRDYTHIQSLVLQVCFYITPIVYPQRALEDKGVSYIFEFNPIYHLIYPLKISLIDPLNPDIMRIILFGLFLSVILLGLGSFLSRREGRRIVFYF